MTIAWMLYTVLVTTLLFLGAIAAEFVCRAMRMPTRLVWTAALGVALALSTRALFMRREPVERRVLTSTTVLDPSAAAGDEPRAIPVDSAVLPQIQPSWPRLVLLVGEAIQVPGRAIASLGDAAPVATDRAIALGLLATAIGGLACILVLTTRVRRIAGRLETREIDGRRVFVSKAFGPALLGIVNPRIVIPHWVLSLDHRQRSVILAHEKQHEDARDPALLAVGATIVALMPWNIVFWFAFSRLRLAIEVDCDRRVLAFHGDVRGYGDLLVTVYERTASSRLHLAFVERPSNLEHRIRRLVDKAPRLSSKRAAAALVTAIVVSVVACETESPTRTGSDSLSASKAAGPSVASVVGVVPRCIAGGGGMGTPEQLMDELRSKARQRHPEAFGGSGPDGIVIALVLDENCAVQQDTLMVDRGHKGSDLVVPYFAHVFGDTAGARRRDGNFGDREGRLMIAYTVQPSESWRARTASTPCGMGIRFDESCGAQGPLEIRKLDSVHALVAVRAFNAPNQRADQLFLITLARPTSALATQSMAHGVVAYQSGALYLEDFLAREPQLWVGTKTSTGLEYSKRKRDVQVIDQLVGIAHYSGHPLTLEQVAQLRPAAKCDGAPGSCYEAGGVAITFP